MEQYSGVSVGLGYATVGARDEGREGREARGEPPHAWRGAEAEGAQTAAANEARVEVWARPGETSGLRSGLRLYSSGASEGQGWS